MPPTSFGNRAVHAFGFSSRVSSSENLVVHQDDLAAIAEHVVAQVDVVQSNSMVEAPWSQLRHRWLYLHTLASFAGLERLGESYFVGHDTLIPRVERGGRTPDEAYRGEAAGLAERLRSAHQRSRGGSR